MNLLKIILASMLVSFFCYAQTAETIEKLIAFENFNEAKNTAINWLNKEPKNAEAYFWAGKVFLAAKNVDSAAIFFNKGFEVNPKFPYSLAGKVSVAFLKNDAGAVPQLVADARDIAGRKDSRLFIELAAAYLNAPDAERVVKVEELAAEAVKYDRKNYRIYMVLGDLYNINPQTTSQAVENYQKAIDYDKGALRAYIQRAAVYEYVDNLSEALTQYVRVMAIEPTYPVVYQKMAEMFYKAKDWIRADTTYALYMKYTEPALDKMKRGVIISYSAKNYKGSIEKIKQVLALDPKDALNTRLLAYSYFELNDSVASKESFESYFRQTEKEKTVAKDYDRYGKLLSRFGKDSLAIISYKTAFGMDSTRTDLISESGKILFIQKKWKEVQAIIEPLITKYPESAGFFDFLFLGQSYFFDTAYVSAKSAFERMTVKFPTSYVGFLWLAKTCTFVSPDVKEGIAKPAYEKVVELLTDKVKGKKFLVEAHSYLGFYYLKNGDNEKSKLEWLAIIELDPENQQAKDNLARI